mmetsp:Transcript_8143/g.13540  ORF Transcript_8143/g.13540 Transcript_8143/m.13540 type:complete len:124 (+) Transcript_8143:844-1215(+)
MVSGPALHHRAAAGEVLHPVRRDFDEIRPAAGARQVLEARAGQQGVQGMAPLVVQRLHLMEAQQRLGGGGRGGIEVKDEGNHRQLMNLRPRSSPSSSTCGYGAGASTLYREMRCTRKLTRSAE